MAKWNLRLDGFTMMAGFLDAVELPEIRAAVDHVLARPLPPGCERPHNTLAPLAWGDALVTRVLASADRRSSLARALGAGDLRWISGYVSVKDPHSEALEWHQDWGCWDHPVSFSAEPAQVAVLVYLGDTSDRTAALRVKPGSHHGTTAASPVTLAVRAGDAVACDYRLLHGTHPNHSHRRRDCLILNFTPAWSALPDGIRAHLIRHPSLPAEGDDTLLPRYSGEPRDLPLSRVGPLDHTAQPDVASRR